MSEAIKNLDSQNFKDAVALPGKPVVVDFWAPWCGPCRAIAPILEQLASELGAAVQICKLNVDQANDVAMQYGIRAIPTLLIFKDGKVADTIVGMASKDELKRRILAA